MTPIRIGYLKGYYGYKNFGDELLGLGVVKYLFDTYPLEKLYIEVDNVDWFSTRLERHKSYIGDNLCKVKLIAKKDKKHVIKLSILSPKVHLFLGGGEIFAPARGWFYGGRNMFILYFWKFFAKKVTLLGGISQATTTAFKILYRLTLPYVEKIILRDKISYEYVQTHYFAKNILANQNTYKNDPNHNKNSDNGLTTTTTPPSKTIMTEVDSHTPSQSTKIAILYHDFAYDVLSDKSILCQVVSTLTTKKWMSKTGLLCPYLLVNTNPYVDMSTLTSKLTTLTQKYPQGSFVYFPCGVEDKPLFGKIISSDVDIDVDNMSTTKGQLGVDKLKTDVDKNNQKAGQKMSTSDGITRSLFDWTEHDIPTILAVCSQATEAIGVRLHFIAMMSWFGIPFQHVVYQEKVDKFLDKDNQYTTIDVSKISC